MKCQFGTCRVEASKYVHIVIGRLCAEEPAVKRFMGEFKAAYGYTPRRSDLEAQFGTETSEVDSYRCSGHLYGDLVPQGWYSVERRMHKLPQA